MVPEHDNVGGNNGWAGPFEEPGAGAGCVRLGPRRGQRRCVRGGAARGWPVRAMRANCRQSRGRGPSHERKALTAVPEAPPENPATRDLASFFAGADIKVAAVHGGRSAIHPLACAIRARGTRQGPAPTGTWWHPKVLGDGALDQKRSLKHTPDLPSHRRSHRLTPSTRMQADRPSGPGPWPSSRTLRAVSAKRCPQWAETAKEACNGRSRFGQCAL